MISQFVILAFAHKVMAVALTEWFDMRKTGSGTTIFDHGHELVHLSSLSLYQMLSDGSLYFRILE